MKGMENAFPKEMLREMAEVIRKADGVKITSRKLCEKFKIDERGLTGWMRTRAAVLEASYLTGVPICADSQGYWLTQNDEQHARYMKHLKGRIQGTLDRIDRLTQIWNDWPDKPQKELF